MARRRLTEDQRQEILKLYREGEDVGVIAARFGVDPSYPTVLAGRRGVTRRMSALAREHMADGALRRTR